jgi:hypothetical protein
VSNLVFRQAEENECQDIVDEPAIVKMKEETTSTLRVREVGTPATLGTFAHTERKSKKMVVHLDRLVPYQGTAGDEWPSAGSSGSIWRVIIVRTDPCGKKERPITYQRHVPLEK